MLRNLLCLASCLLVTNHLWGQNPDVNRILSRYEAIRPAADDLSMYRLDWAESLEQALQRAAREGRAIFLVIIHAKYGDISSGHC